MHDPWRTFDVIINKCLSGKITGLDKIHLSIAQILYGMYYKKNIDFVALLWEYFAFQIENRDHKKQEKMYYPIFTKAIIHHFLSKDKTISMRNKMFMHTAQDDSILGTLRFVPKDEDAQVYEALIPTVMTTLDIQDSRAYQTYLAFATGASTPKRKSKRENHTHQASGSGDGVGSQPKVPDEPKCNTTSTNKGTESGDDDDSNDDVNDDDSNDGVNDDDGNDDESDDDGNNDASDDERLESGDFFFDDQNDDDKDEEYEEEYVRTPTNNESTDNENEHVDEEEYDRIDEELYKDVNVKLKDVDQ
ncbi:hypothetical protein Tco_0923571 [Tanacetum coccineum]|uniref:Uncharacterized protein n=1 Tax=Tanacetum coccineum TaxID=301880 RepID=A0ABQ5D463_9ASTR